MSISGVQLQTTPKHLHKRHTQNTDWVGTRALLSKKKKKSCSIVPTHKDLYCSHDQSSQPFSLRVNPFHWHSQNNQGLNTVVKHTKLTCTMDIPRASGSGNQGDCTTGLHRLLDPIGNPLHEATLLRPGLSFSTLLHRGL